MPSMSDTSINFIRLWKLVREMGWDVNLIVSEDGNRGYSQLGGYHRFEYEYSKDVAVRAHVFDKGLVGPEVEIFSLQHGTLLTVRALCLEHAVSAVKEVLAWVDETSPCSSQKTRL